jgi:hypothetical protein
VSEPWYYVLDVDNSRRYDEDRGKAVRVNDTKLPLQQAEEV